MTALHGSMNLCRVEDQAQGQMEWLAKHFPDEFGRALRHVGWRYKNAISNAIFAGGSPAESNPKLSLMRQYRRMDLMRRVNSLAGTSRDFSKLTLKRVTKKHKRAIKAGRAENKKHFHRWKVWGRRSREHAFQGRLANTVRYKFHPHTQVVRIGFLSASASRYAEAVQAGRRGDDGSFSFTRRQPVTDKMRRAFWAAGVPLSKDTTYIEQPERPIVQPVYEQLAPELPQIVEDRIYTTIAKSKGSVWPVLPVGRS